MSSRATCLLLLLYLAMYPKWQAKEEEEEEREPATDYKKQNKFSSQILSGCHSRDPKKRCGKGMRKNAQRNKQQQAGTDDVCRGHEVSVVEKVSKKEQNVTEAIKRAMEK